MEKVIRMGIIGYGGMARHHHKMLKNMSGIQVVAVYDISDDANKVAKENGLTVCASADELLKTQNLDLVLVATPNEVHRPYALQVMDAGINVISEKPVAMNSGELQDMIDKSKETGKLFTVHQNRRWDKDYRIFREVMKSGVIGNIWSIETRVSGANGIPGDWRAKKQHGGGMVLDWGVHLIDQILDTFKEKVTQVYAKVNHITTQEVDDGFKAILTFETGMVVLVEVTTNTYINFPRWHVSGLDGTMIIEDWDNNGRIVREKYKEGFEDLKAIQAGTGLTKTLAPRGESSIEELPLPDVKADWSQYYENVIAHLNGEQEIIVKQHEVMRVMKLMETIFQSEKEGKAIDCSL